jgi:hypothetical protein
MNLGDSRRKVWLAMPTLDDAVDFHRFAPLNNRDLLTPYPARAFAAFGDEPVDRAIAA